MLGPRVSSVGDHVTCETDVPLKITYCAQSARKGKIMRTLIDLPFFRP